jgi:hypothetical protein
LLAEILGLKGRIMDAIQQTTAAIDPALVRQKVDWERAGLARTIDLNITPEEIEAALEMARGKHSGIQHLHLTLYIEQVIEPRDEFRACLATLQNPQLTPRERTETEQALGRHLARWQIVFGDPLRVPLQRMLVLPDYYFLDERARELLLQVVETQIARQLSEGYGHTGPALGRDIWQRFFTAYMNHVRTLQSQLPSDPTPPGAWQNFTRWVGQRVAQWRMRGSSRPQRTSGGADQHDTHESVATGASVLRSCSTSA